MNPLKTVYHFITRGIRYMCTGAPNHIVYVNVVSLQPSELLKDRCALITGGTSGIGYEIAKAYLNAGATVCITGRNEERTKAKAEQLEQETNKKGCVYSISLDNTDVNSFSSKITAVIEMTGEIDILVNNAGVNGSGMPKVEESEYDKIIDTNLKGVFFLSQLIGKYFVANGIKGNILNIASASSLRPADSPYTISKWGVRGLTLGLAKSLAKNGVTVNAIAPGPTATRMMVKDEQTNMYLSRLPLGRYIMSEEISNMAVICVSDMGRSIIGDTIYMTGGAGNLTYDDVKYSF